MFMYGKQGIDEYVFQIYRYEILVPQGNPIPEDIKAISSCDDDLAHIDNTVSPDSLPVYRENMISAAKENATRLGTEEFANRKEMFKQMQTFDNVIDVLMFLLKDIQ